MHPIPRPSLRARVSLRPTEQQPNISCPASQHRCPDVAAHRPATPLTNVAPLLAARPSAPACTSVRTRRSRRRLASDRAWRLGHRRLAFHRPHIHHVHVLFHGLARRRRRHLDPQLILGRRPCRLRRVPVDHLIPRGALRDPAERTGDTRSAAGRAAQTGRWARCWLTLMDSAASLPPTLATCRCSAGKSRPTCRALPHQLPSRADALWRCALR
mmetsp:Transcript_40318/g.100290  ORF Transcript_40318/g.100290 Transcript_40318/m.100290 type:complete len:214 (+) Transcript_40318:58-699(+)